MAEQKINRNYLMIGGLALATIITFIFIQVFDSSNSSNSADSELEEQLGQEILELESSILELELVYQEKDKELDNMFELVDQKNDRLVAMERRIQELEDEGVVSKETIARLRQKLERARRLTESQEKINILVQEQNTMTQMYDSLRQTLYQRDSALRVAEAMLIDCSGQTSGSDRGLEPVEPLVWAENIRVYNVLNESRDKKVEVRRDIKRADIERLQICLDLKGNSLVSELDGELYLILRTMGGSTYQNPAASSRSITLNGRETMVSSVVDLSKVDAASASDVCFEYFQNDAYNFGRCIIELYYNQTRLSQTKIINFVDN